MAPPAAPLRLLSGALMPRIGLGTWRIASADVERAVFAALDAGYRHLDLAYIYSSEPAVGCALHAWLKRNPSVRRQDLFVTSKLWMTEYHPDRVRPALERTLADLQLDYLDLYLMHWPFPLDPAAPSKRPPAAEAPRLADTWTALAKLAGEGPGALVRAIGVSNFNRLTLESLPAPKPSVNQVEMHPLLPQQNLLRYCRERGIVVTAYCPLGSVGAPLLADPRVVAIQRKHSASDPAHVLLSWGLRRGCAVIPKSANPTRIASNLNCHVALDDEDMKTLDDLPKVSGIGEKRYCNSSSFWGFDVHSEDLVCL